MFKIFGKGEEPYMEDLAFHGGTWKPFRNNVWRWLYKMDWNQESCALSSRKPTYYIKLERDTRQGDPISAYLFILVIEMAFTLITTNNNIEGLDIFNHNFLYTVHADKKKTTFWPLFMDGVQLPQG